MNSTLGIERSGGMSFRVIMGSGREFSTLDDLFETYQKHLSRRVLDLVAYTDTADNSHY